MAKSDKTKSTEVPESLLNGSFDVDGLDEIDGKHLAETPPDALLEQEQLGKMESQPEKIGERWCPVHNCRMQATASRKTHTEFKCRVPGCDSKVVQLRPKVPVPAEPLQCGSCSGLEKPIKSFCVVNNKKSTAVCLHMECEKCGWNVKVPRPDAHARAAKERRAPSKSETLTSKFRSSSAI